MNKQVLVAVASAFVVSNVGIARADDPNPVTHPIAAYDNHEVKENTKEVHEDATKMAQTDQSVKDQKDFMDQRKAEYDKALKDNGADSDVTKSALAKYKDAEKKYRASVHKHHHAAHEMNQDQNDLNHAQHELNKDTAPAN